MDTVYGLCADPSYEGPVRELYRMKQRPAEQPMALLAKDVDFLFELVPELRGRPGILVRALLPGPFTLVLPNPGERFHWLTGSTPDRIGVRVPELSGPGAEVLERVGAVVATSANLRGGPEPPTWADRDARVVEAEPDVAVRERYDTVRDLVASRRADGDGDVGSRTLRGAK